MAYTLTDLKAKSSFTLMVQGTTSDAGKSVITAGLCRLLAREQHSVAPFKPQNMALNSAVTVDGGEIGRSQALQAQACYLAPHTDMNPVLLKPSSDTGAQVIIHGKAISAMQAQQFHNYKATAMQAVLDSHQRLSQQYQKIIVEGAGSPAEINLRDNDIANMGFAEAVDCPVVIVADIDRGGVFAHLVGTLELLSKSEQARVVGFIINRFRGDIALLEPGLEWLEKKTKKPVLGVLPYLSHFYLDAEDAINIEQTCEDESSLNVLVPVLPRISNHTDFDALRLHPQVNLQYISVEQDWPQADLVILPGSKNVRSDLQSLITSGWQQKLDKHLRYGGKVLGICGGFQMLGEQISDPAGIEDKAGTSQGFNLLALNTVLEPHKQLHQVEGCFADYFTDSIEFGSRETVFSGYEIHCGISQQIKSSSDKPLLTIHGSKNTRFDGLVSADQQVAGCYIHGLFDHPDACKTLLSWAGLESKTNKAIDLNQHREQQLDRLADCLIEHLKPDFLSAIRS